MFARDVSPLYEDPSNNNTIRFFVEGRLELLIETLEILHEPLKYDHRCLRILYFEIQPLSPPFRLQLPTIGRIQRLWRSIRFVSFFPCVYMR